MTQPEKLLARLNEIGHSLEARGTAVALIGLGSVGRELERLDQYSDLDFFAIVKPGYKDDYLNDLSWLTAIAPVSYSFKNTDDGHKLLYEDGVFCEFAVFEEAELEKIPFAPGRLVWKAKGVSEGLAAPANAPGGYPPKPESFLLGEALTNLYVGLLRDLRGERLTATRFIQVHALDRTLELVEQKLGDTSGLKDRFMLDRRVERRFPAFVPQLAEMAQGYDKNHESALAILTYLDAHFEINQGIKQKILALCRAAI